MPKYRVSRRRITDNRTGSHHDFFFIEKHVKFLWWQGWIEHRVHNHDWFELQEYKTLADAVAEFEFLNSGLPEISIENTVVHE